MLHTKTERFLALAVAFLAGCEASRVARVGDPTIEQTARADAPLPAQRWQYTCRFVHQEDEATDLANQLGARGWEMSGTSGVNPTLLCFKRSAQ
jgi:hypothetical protein